ncbi:MAG: HEAT repeat domain-containing protein, partial [Planctomycetota bacterium]
MFLANCLALLCCAPAGAQGPGGGGVPGGGGATAPAQTAPAQTAPAQAAPAQGNPYNLKPFHADFPVVLDYPARLGLEYDRTRRQVLERLAANLQGNVRREAWHLATEFFWRAPEDAVEPLVAAMDRVFGNPALDDVVKNCVEAMGKMANEELDVPLQRALEHSNPNVRQAAFAALATSGKASTLPNMAAWFERMDGRARAAWLRSLRVRLGAEATPIFKQLMMADYQSAVRDQVLRETLQLPAANAAEILRGRWP